MEKIQRLKEMGFYNLVHAEVASFMSTASSFMAAVGAEALQVEAQDLEEFAQLVVQLIDYMKENTSCQETPEIQRLVAAQRKLMTYLRDSCRGIQKMHIPEYRDAARQIYPQLAPHARFNRLPQMQLVTVVDAVLDRLADEPYPQLLAQLSFSDIVEELTKNNRLIHQLVQDRSSRRSRRPVDMAQKTRIRLIHLYDYLSTRIWALSIIHPTPQLDRLISNLNALVDSHREAYNRRMAQSKRKKKPSK